MTGSGWSRTLPVVDRRRLSDLTQPTSTRTTLEKFGKATVW
jgi:hypothetical protein